MKNVVFLLSALAVACRPASLHDQSPKASSHLQGYGLQSSQEAWQDIHDLDDNHKLFKTLTGPLAIFLGNVESGIMIARPMWREHPAVSGKDPTIVDYWLVGTLSSPLQGPSVGPGGSVDPRYRLATAGKSIWTPHGIMAGQGAIRSGAIPVSQGEKVTAYRSFGYPERTDEERSARGYAIKPQTTLFQPKLIDPGVLGEIDAGWVDDQAGLHRIPGNLVSVRSLVQKRQLIRGPLQVTRDETSAPLAHAASTSDQAVLIPAHKPSADTLTVRSPSPKRARLASPTTPEGF